MASQSLYIVYKMIAGWIRLWDPSVADVLIERNRGTLLQSSWDQSALGNRSHSLWTICAPGSLRAKSSPASRVSGNLNRIGLSSRFSIDPTTVRSNMQGKYMVNFDLFYSIILIILAVNIVKMLREEQVLNPYLTFLPAIISILIYFPNVNPNLLDELHREPKYLIIISMLSYFLGLLLIRKKKLPSRNGYSKPRFLFYPAFALAALPLTLGSLHAGIPILSEDFDTTRANFYLPIVGQFLIFVPFCLLLAARQGGKKQMALAILLNCFWIFALPSKFNIGILLAFICYIALGEAHGKVRRWKLVSFICAIFVFSIVLFEFNYNLRGFSAQPLTNWWHDSVLFRGAELTIATYFMLPYLYVSAPIQNFNFVVMAATDYHFGRYTFYSVISFFQLGSLIEMPPKPLENISFNTHYFPTDFFLDFGPLGVGAFSLGLGALTKSIYNKSLPAHAITSQGIWIVFAFGSLMLFFNNHFTSLSYPIVSLLSFSLYGVFFKRV